VEMILSDPEAGAFDGQQLGISNQTHACSGVRAYNAGAKGAKGAKGATAMAGLRCMLAYAKIQYMIEAMILDAYHHTNQHG
jgi:hypothetical protein